jgi:lysophospholipase L1-like esterase
MMMTRTLPLLYLALVAACADGATAPTSTPTRRLPTLSVGEHDRVGTYVAMGTSLSMGVMSNGVVAADQAQSWPAQLAALAGVPFSQPLIHAPGCQPPLLAPLATLRRVNGESPFVRSSVCAPLTEEIGTPTQNLAISEAITANALATTPESPSPASWPLKGEFYRRVLGAGQTQLTAMLAQQPDLVSVEFGVNEVLGARSGLLIPGVTMVPTAAWRPAYDQLIAGVKTAGAKVLLVGLLSNAGNFPSLRLGAELDANRSELAQFGIVVSDDCGGTGSENLIFVPAKVVGAYAAAMAARAAGQPVTPLSCADVPGTQDYVLTRADIGALEAQLADMNAHVRDVATENGFAFFDLDPLYGQRHLKAPFSATTLLMSDEPYGPLISMDGVHPSAEGHRILAREAAKALNVTYHLALPRGVVVVEQR